MMLTIVSAFLTVGSVAEKPVHSVENLSHVIVWERTGGTGPAAYTFGVNDARLYSRLSDPLGPQNADFTTGANEAYDVFLSHADGTLDADGAYLTMEAVFGATHHGGGGLNVSEVELVFGDGTRERASVVSSYLVNGDNAVEGNVGRAVDDNLLTHTVMGNTAGFAGRLRITVGFPSTLDTELALDVRPGSCVNPLNASSNGVLPVAVTGTPVFDAGWIAPLTARLEGVAPVHVALEDVTGGECTTGPDGIDDLVLHFPVQPIVEALELQLGRPLCPKEVLTVQLEAALSTAGGGGIGVGESTVTAVGRPCLGPGPSPRSRFQRH